VSTEAAHLASALGDVEIVPPGIHWADYQKNGPRKAEGIVFLGRNEPRKGLPVLLKAWPQVRARHPDAELIVIGNSSEDDDPHGVKYAGRVSEEEKRRLLASAAVMVAPNLGGESFGIVVLEAMASGCAIVASDIPAFRNLTAGTAVLFPAGNDQGLAVAVSDLLDDRIEIERRSAAGRARAVDFDWSRVLPAYQTCYELAASRAGRGVG
jgi:phosphatidyl-myo-inositol alpha-mannosyltransferase